MYDWSFRSLLYVNSPPAASLDGSEEGPSWSFVIVIALGSATAIHFQSPPPHLESGNPPWS